MNINEQFQSSPGNDNFSAMVKPLVTGVTVKSIHSMVMSLNDEDLAKMDAGIQRIGDETNCEAMKKGSENLRVLVKLLRAFRADCAAQLMTNEQIEATQHLCTCGNASPEESKCA